MTTSATKTRALCVATRCTSVEQFVATFHRFCGDDQTFFVATLTSRPIGLETAFSIQLVDKQPVLRGLCVVLDTWATPENRYKRPGIRLGIKRLTAESQVVFDRLRAASKAPGAIAEATPPPGPLPGPPAAPARPPTFSRRTSTSTPPPLPPLAAPRAGLPAVPAVRASTAIPSPALRTPGPAPLPALRMPAIEPLAPPAPRAPVVEPPRVPAVPAIPAVSAIEPPAAVLRDSAAAPAAMPDVPEAPPGGDPSPSDPPADDPDASAHGRSPQWTPAPIAVTRFQVALNVDGVPPPIDDVEFKPTQLIRRQRSTQAPRITSDPLPEDLAVEPGQPALIVDRPGVLDERPAPDLAAQDVVPQAPQDVVPQDTVPHVASSAPPAADLRTPGSAFVLPANPLHNLSDESLEGFVDCTLYEETGNFFHPATDGGGWNDEVADPPVAPLATRPAPPSVPAMPFDTPPNLTVRSQGDSESLRVAPDDPVAPPPIAGLPPAGGPRPTTEPSAPLTATDALFAPQARATTSAAWLETASADYVRGYAPPSPPHGPDAPPPAAPGAMPSLHDAAGHAEHAGHADHAEHAGHAEHMGHAEHTGHAEHMGHAHAEHGPVQPSAAYPSHDPALYAPYPASLPIALPAPPVQRHVPPWQRALLIAGSTLAAIIVAFVVARRIRGPERGVPAPVAKASPAAPRSSAPPRSAAPAAASGASGAPSPPIAATAASRAPRPAAADVAARPAAADPAAGSADDLPPDEDGEAVAAGTPLVGSGPCRFTVATTPAGSIIRLDDQPMGPSPITIEGTCDKHKVDVSHARYQNVTRWVTLAADKPQELDINLPRPIHAVTVTSLPPGAELSIDGHRAGTTPTVVQMVGFATVNLTFTKQGFQSVTKKVYSKLPQDRVFVKLAK